MNIIIDKVEIDIAADFSKFMDSPEIIGKTVTHLKEVFPEIENIRSGYLFKAEDYKILFFVLSQGLKFLDEKVDEKSKGMYCECFNLIKENLGEDNILNSVKTNISALFIPEDEIDVSKCYDKILLKSLPGIEGICLRHLGFIISKNPKVQLGIATVTLEDKKRAFHCIITAYEKNVEISKINPYSYFENKSITDRIKGILEEILIKYSE